ncbi:UNVERIFIED_CONTAM: hypothetical protein FKN15_035728 [Acipenser sinensis]
MPTLNRLIGYMTVLESHVKAEWIVPPVKVRENEDYSSKNPIAKIRSDVPGVVRYEIVGEGADQKPYHLFTINPDNGEISITAIVDREEKAIYELRGRAYNSAGKQVESNIDLKIKIEDVNDNSPRFTQKTFSESVYELNTFVMQINATDADEPNSRNSLIAYEILEQSPADMFYVERNTGRVMVAESTLDREKQSKYTLTVQAKDLDGELGGLANTVQLDIKIKDVNDNAPALEMESYEGSVVENTKGVEVMRMKALDADEEFSDNWLAEFEIESGNEGGYFRIETDAKTNEGILILQKEIDYEEIQSLALTVVVRNKAAFHTSITSSSYSLILKHILVKINVKNEPEGPKFSPKVKVIPISEETSKVVLSKVIAKYPAIDADSGKIAERVKYVKKYDLDNWLIIDPKTGDIKLAKVPDRESKFLVNGTYTAEILAITDDLPAKTATGTVAIQVEDFNDHCPTLTSTSTDMCSNDKSVIVTAVDEDADPNSVPFKYKIVDEPEGTSMLLRPTKTFWPGQYGVPLLIYDQQGKSCSDKQVLNIAVCTCTNTGACAPQSDRLQSTGARLGAAAIGLMILGLLLLLRKRVVSGHNVQGGMMGYELGSLHRNVMPGSQNVMVTEKTVVSDSSMQGGKMGFGQGTLRMNEMPGSQNVVLLENRGFDQGSMRFNEPVSQNVVLTGKRVVSGHNVQGGMMGYELGSLHRNVMPGSQNVMVTEKTVVSDSSMQGGKMGFGQGTLRMNEMPGSQNVVLLENRGFDQGSMRFNEPVSQNVVLTGKRVVSGHNVQGGMMGYELGSLHRNVMPGSQNVMVTEKTVVSDSSMQGGKMGFGQGTLRMNEMPGSQNVVLLENRGFDQGSMRFNEPVSQNVVLTGKRVVSGHNVQGGMMGYELGSLHRNVMPGSQNVMVTEKTVVSDSSMQGGKMGFGQGTLRMNEMPGSQNVVLLENRGFDQGSMRFNEPVSQNVVLTGKRVVSGHNVQGGMMGYELGSLHRNVMPGSQNVMVTEKTVVSDSSMQGGKMGFGQGTLRMNEMPGSQNVVLLENRGFDQGSMRLSEPVSHNVVSGHNVQGGMMGYELGSLHRNVMPGSQNVMVTEKTVVSDSSMQGGKMGFGQGTLRMNEMPGSQNVVLLENRGFDQGSMRLSEPVSHNVVSGHNVQGGMMGYELGSLHRNVMPGSQNVMVTEKTVVSDSSMQGGKMGFGQGTLRMNEMPGSQNVVLLENRGFDQGSMRLSEPVSHNVVSGHNVQGGMMGYELGSLHRNKANYVSAEGHPQKDSMLVYDYEGQESPVGSIGSCSFIEEDLDQSFLNELGPKFKTLAEICRGTEMTSGVSVKQPSVAGQHTTVSTNSAITNNCVVTNKTIEVTSPVPALQVQKNVVVTENVSPPQPTVYLQKNVVVSDPGYVQQPVYYATNPVIQTTRYIVEPQIQRNVMIERSSVPGLQGHLLMSDIPSTQNVMVTQKRLVHGSDIQGGMVVGLDQGTLRTSEMPSSQNVLLLENRGFDQGSMRFNEPVSQNVVLTGKRVVSGHNVQGGMMGSSVPQCFSTLGALKPRCLGALSVQVLPNIGGFVSWCSIASLSRCLDILGPLIPLKVFGTSAPVAPDVSEQDVVMSEEEQDALYIAGSWDEESFLWGETQDPDLTQVMVPSSELAFQCPQALFGRLWNESSTSVRFPGRQSLNSAGLHSDQPRL